MNNDLEQFSEKSLKNICEFTKGGVDVLHVEIEALARIALAAKQAKPMEVLQFIINNPEKDGYFEWADCNQDYFNSISTDYRRVLYTTPQPAHTEHVIPSEIPKVPHNGVMAYKKDGSIYSTNYARGWNDCVQAMLAAAPKPESE